LLHFSKDSVTITKERYYRLLEIEEQYKAQQQEPRRLQGILEDVIHHFEDNPKMGIFAYPLETVYSRNYP
jgi:hypothetical protein